MLIFLILPVILLIGIIIFMIFNQSVFGSIFDEYSDYVGRWEGLHGYDNPSRDETETMRGIQIGTWQHYAPLVGLNPSHEAFLAMSADDTKKIKNYMWGQYTGGESSDLKRIISVEMVWSGGNFFWAWLNLHHPEYAQELGASGGNYPDQRHINEWLNNHSVDEWYDLFKEYITVGLADLYAQYPGWGRRWGFTPLTQYDYDQGFKNILDLFADVRKKRWERIGVVLVALLGFAGIIYYFWDSIINFKKKIF